MAAPRDINGQQSTDYCSANVNAMLPIERVRINGSHFAACETSVRVNTLENIGKYESKISKMLWIEITNTRAKHAVFAFVL